MHRYLSAALALAAIAAAVCACTAVPEPAGGGREDPSGAALSAPGRQEGDRVPGDEVRAQSSTLETWALLYEPTPWQTGEEVKVVWRTTGTGGFDVVAVGPRSRRVAPVSGPTLHTYSNWNRPGDEWGTVFRLDEPGDWVLRVRRGGGTASLPITVTPA